MGKQSKQTRKFAPKLKKVIQRRREYQKNRDKYKKNGTSNGEEDDRKIQKQQPQKVKNQDRNDNEEHVKDIKKKKQTSEDDELAGLNADEFLEEGFFNEMGEEEESGEGEVLFFIYNLSFDNLEYISF